VILAEGESIQPAHLQLSAPPLQVEAHQAPVDPWAGFDWSGSLSDVTRRAVAQVERRKVQRALEEAGGDRTRAAAALQVPVRFLLGKLREYRLE
jgi:DNA-binding NtrC family response regulator